MTLRFAKPAPETRLTPLTIRHLLDGGERRDLDQEIVYGDRVRLTYRDFRKRVGRLAAALHGLGVDQGTTIAVLEWDSHRYLECFFAVPMMGAVLQTVNVRLSPEQVEYTLADAEAEILLVHQDFLPLVAGMRERLTRVRAIVVLADDEALVVPDWTDAEYERLIATAPATFDFVDFDENALATTFYTSGTTGRPKGVSYSHRQLVLHTLAGAAALGGALGPGLRRGDVYMPLTPMFHVHAWGFPYIATMMGLKQVYPGRFDAARVLRLRQREGVTFSHCVPTVLRMLVDALPGVGGDLAGWHVLTGGSALSPDLHEAAAAAGVTAVSAFGMSETCPLISLDETRAPGDTIRSGSPLPLVQIRIADDRLDGVPADDQSLGELVLRAPWLTASYRGDEAASEDLWRGGWLHTQDIATMDERGSILIRDRLKDLVKTGGEWICSLTLEALLSSHPKVGEVAVVGVPDPKWQERPVAVIVAKDGEAPSAADLNAWLSPAVTRGELSRYALLDAVHARPALPRTSVGKIDKKALRAELAAGSGGARR